jgi:hypothetical protein
MQKAASFGFDPAEFADLWQTREQNNHALCNQQDFQKRATKKKRKLNFLAFFWKN